MTKVKTILREFCSAKDILAINRLGLLSKGEEREAQPIPWRHRLKRGERRELVRSELRMNVNRPTTRLSARDKAKAVSTAVNPQQSKMGEHLLHVHGKDSSRLDGKLGRLSNEQRRREHQMYHTKRSFLQQSQCLNREPLILVERPPTPDVLTRAAFMTRYGVDPELVSIPSYQRPLLSRARTPSTITTIDAFAVETKKKRNVWDEAFEDKDSVKFKSSARPSAKLTDHEVTQLKIGRSLHKPTQESIAEVSRRKIARHKKPALQLDDWDFPDERRLSCDSDAISPVFLTELSKSHTVGTSRALKSLKTATALTKAQSKDPFPRAVPHGLHNHKKAKSSSLSYPRSKSAGAEEYQFEPSSKKYGGKQTETVNSSGENSDGTHKKPNDFLSILVEEADA